jgi:HD-GYP domain-containing protein (c-di-GMP phosphodiesterase class II)
MAEKEDTKHMDENKEEGLSLFSQSADFMDSDPLEEIFALNLGDFLSEHLISDDLAQKISEKETDKTEGLKKQLSELISIYSKDKTLTILGFNSKEDYIIYNSIAKTIKEMSAVDACHIYLTKDNAGGLFDEDKDLVLVGTSVKIKGDLYAKNIGYNKTDNSAAMQAYNTRQVVELLSSDLKNYKPIKDLKEDRATYCLSVPMKSSMNCVGVIVVQNYDDKELDPNFINMCEITAALFATSMAFQKESEIAEKLINDENAEITDLGDEQQAFVENLARAVDSRSHFRQDYSKAVAQLSVDICTELGLNEKTKDLVYYAALLRNIGKITLPIEIFDKKGDLTKEEWSKLYNHPNIGVNLLMSINFMAEVIPYIHYHKERWNGTGREGLSGQSIPLGSRIIAISDAYCALTTERTYRKAMTKEKALEIMKQEANEKWDPMLVEVLLKIKNYNK